MKILVVRYVSVPVEVGTLEGDFGKWFDLPTMPVPGMGLMVDKDCGEETIESCFFNERGTPICRMGSDIQNAEEIDPLDSPEYFEFLTNGWMTLSSKDIRTIQ